MKRFLFASAAALTATSAAADPLTDLIGSEAYGRATLNLPLMIDPTAAIGRLPTFWCRT